MQLDHPLYAPYHVTSPFKLASIDTSDTQGWKKEDAKVKRAQNREEIAELQERLYAEGKRSVLLVLQAMDAAGKDSTIESITRGVNPQGVHVTSFKAPSKEELAHDFLWRVHDHAPRKGTIGIFNRSHYEDVLIVKVKGFAPPALVEKRYGHISDFERLLADHGTRIVKVMLYASKDHQLERFRQRLEEPSKWWKFNPADLKERELWDQYMAAYETALNRTSTDYAPWYVVPAEKKWFRTLVVSQLLLDTLKQMNPKYPPPSFDPAEFPPDSLV
ncbi:MAG: polyphosphate kinase 2 family protein [Bacteroidota bacterium]